MRKAMILAMPVLLAGCLPQNLGLESQHKPIVEANHASVKGCPDWSSQGVDSAAGTDSNYGCATNSNLAAMIANPQDLVHGAQAAPGDSSDVAVRAIRGGGVPTTPSTSSVGSAVSAAAPRGN